MAVGSTTLLGRLGVGCEPWLTVCSTGDGSAGAVAVAVACEKGFDLGDCLYEGVVHWEWHGQAFKIKIKHSPIRMQTPTLS